MYSSFSQMRISYWIMTGLVEGAEVESMSKMHISKKARMRCVVEEGKGTRTRKDSLRRGRKRGCLLS